MKIEDVKNAKGFRGKAALLKHLNGQKITQQQAITAKCFDCQGFYEDGFVVCDDVSCPLQPYLLRALN